MKELKKEDIKQEVFDLYDDYAHSRIERREFMQKLSTYAVGGITVAALSGFLMPVYSGPVQGMSDDPRIKSTYVYYESPKGGGRIKALLSMPADANGNLGGIVVAHVHRGLNPDSGDGARRAPGAGCISLAPDTLSPGRG